MARKILAEEKVHSSIIDKLGGEPEGLQCIAEGEAALQQHQVLVVGMSQNPFPKKACKLLKELDIPFKYLEYGSYLGDWRRRGALKMWSGWQTFPMIFINGQLIGGYSDLQALHSNKSLDQALQA